MEVVTAPINYITGELIPKFHIYLQFMIGLLIIWFMFKKKESKARKKLSPEEISAFISKWKPDPLVSSKQEYHDSSKARIVESKIGKYVVINGKNCLNLASLSFLGLNENGEIEESAIKSVRKYGVGSCGPRGFYGTVDVHLELEERLAQFMEVEEAVVYSYGFSTISSAIPAYAKRGDIVFVDEEANYAIQKGLDASRSEIKLFKHNDMNDLERLLEQQEQIDQQNKKKAAKTRKFLIVEGIYFKTGKMCPLPKLIELRKKYKLRIFIDESISFGTLGKSGRGITEHFNISMKEVDLIMASMERAIGSVGGFCVGSTFIVEHQRLSGLGYCFSASLPPLLTTAAIKALDIIENNPQIVCELQDISSLFHESLSKSSVIMSHFCIVSDPLSPIKHLMLKSDNYDQLNTIIKLSEENLLAITQPAFLSNETKPVIPSIRLSINRLLTNSDIDVAIKSLEDAIINSLCA